MASEWKPITQNAVSELKRVPTFLIWMREPLLSKVDPSRKEGWWRCLWDQKTMTWQLPEIGIVSGNPTALSDVASHYMLPGSPLS